MQTFDYKFNMGASIETTQTVLKNQYNDGYVQRVSVGINNRREIWSGSKTGDYETVIKPIMDFIDAHKGAKPFYWVNPFGVKNKYVCEGYSVSQRKGNFWQISLKFEQVF